MDSITDWNLYYQKESKISGFTRKITEKYIIDYLNKYLNRKNNIEISELGGANSCFIDSVTANFDCKKYSIVDNNQFGIDKFKNRKIKPSCQVELVKNDVLNGNTSGETFDCCYSVGLVEHFGAENTAKAIRTHFEYTKDGGIVLISFPTPTFQYCFIRKAMELLRIWKFFDERPLKIEEIMPCLEKYGTVLTTKLIKKLPLTQMMCVVKKENK